MLASKRGTMLRVCDAARSIALPGSGLGVPRLKNIVASPSRAVAAQPQATRDSTRSRCGADFVGTRDCGISGQDQD
jgi:hypothetical protein